MEQTRTTFKQAFPYQQDAMNLPVASLDTALPFYETVLGFQLVSRAGAPHPSAILSRDAVQIGLAENGGDPAQDGCFFEIDSLPSALAELQTNGLHDGLSGVSTQQHGDVSWQVFFVVAPDGLCYCYGERQA